MSNYWITEINGMEHAQLLHRMNGLEPDTFPPLTSRHLEHGYWWTAEIDDGTAIAFASMVPMTPFDGVGYLKRAYVLPQHRGQGLQQRFLHRRERKARELGWHTLVSETAVANLYSQRNFERAGFTRCEPEQPWGAPGSVYFWKRLSA